VKTVLGSNPATLRLLNADCNLKLTKRKSLLIVLRSELGHYYIKLYIVNIAKDDVK